MSTDNPFQSPAQEEFTPSHAPKIQIMPFGIRKSAFKCTVLSPQELAENLRDETIKYCQDLGFQVVEEDAEYRIEGEFVKVDEGNRILRYLLSGLAGFSKLEVAGEIRGGELEARPFRFKQVKAIGAMGGDSKSLLKRSLYQIALKIGSEAGSIGKRIDPAQADRAVRYLGFLALVAVLVACLLGGISYLYGTVVTEPLNDNQYTEQIIWSVIVGVVAFTVAILSGIALAPEDVLSSRTLLWLRSSSGVSTIFVLRILLGAIGMALTGIILLRFTM